VSHWIETSLHRAVVALTHSGETAIAADLGRLLEEPELRELRLYRSRVVADLADELFDCESIDHLVALLPHICSAFAVAHCTIVRVRECRIGRYGARVASTYPQAWLDRYMERRYFSIDPVVARALASAGTFFWDEVERADPLTAGFYQASLEHGIGPAGITFAADDAGGDRYAISLSVPLSHVSFRRIFAERLPDFHEIARLLVDVFGELTGVPEAEAMALTEDQLRFLRALTCGQSTAEAARLPISYGSVATLETSILRALNATNIVQAVAIAAKRRLLEVVPFFGNDIHRQASDERGLDTDPSACASAA
jgi:DNA-binding CsgD family transcriptional regulator